MINIYGIKNCDMVQKALKWLDAQNIPYTFHDYKEHGPDKATVEHWMQHLPLNKLINNRSTTFRELPESEKAGIDDPKKAAALMMKHSSVIKRPVWDFGNGNMLLGWDEAEVRKRI